MSTNNKPYTLLTQFLSDPKQLLESLNPKAKKTKTVDRVETPDPKLFAAVKNSWNDLCFVKTPKEGLQGVFQEWGLKRFKLADVIIWSVRDVEVESKKRTLKGTSKKELKKEVGGFVLLQMYKSGNVIEGYIDILCSKPKSGQGIRLGKEAEKVAKAFGCTQMRLSSLTYVANFYKNKLGYREVNAPCYNREPRTERRKPVRIPGSQSTAVNEHGLRMTKCLHNNWDPNKFITKLTE